MEFITRANFGMSVGCFELDLADGELRYRTGVEYRGQRLPGWLIRNTIVAAMDAVAVYAGALDEVVHGRLTPFEAVELAESEGS